MVRMYVSIRFEIRSYLADVTMDTDIFTLYDSIPLDEPAGLNYWGMLL